MITAVTTSDLNDRQSGVRPAGISAIAIACFVLAGLLLASAALIWTTMVSVTSGRYILGDYATMGPVLYLITAFGLTMIGMGLLKKWRFMRRMAIIAAALLLGTSILPISAAVAYLQIAGIVVQGVKIILAVIAIRYLLQPEVVAYFSAKSAQ